MTDSNPSVPSGDPFDLQRFIQAQAGDYAQALSELRRGHKQSHWMWYIFPQYAGLGRSSTSVRYAIKSVDEARAYLAHPLLGLRLMESAHTVLKIEGRSAHAIFGSPDDMKLQSCATLFAHVSRAGSVFEQLLVKYFGGAVDSATLRLLGGSETNV